MSGFMSVHCKLDVNHRRINTVTLDVVLKRGKNENICLLVLVGGHVLMESCMMTWN